MLDDGDKAVSYDCRANLYSDSVLCSADVLQKLMDDYDYEGDGYACWDFRSRHQDGYEDTHMLVNVSDCGDGWFVYQGIDMGWLFDRSVRLIKKDGVIIIDSLYLGDIRNYGKDDVPSERENGVIPDSLVYSPGVDEQELLDLLFPDRKNDEYAVFEIQKNLIASDHSRQILSIYINDGIHECYSVYAIDLNEREYTRFGTFNSVRFNNTEFTGYDTMINEEGDLGYLRTENVYSYDGSLLRSVSNLYTDEY